MSQDNYSKLKEFDPKKSIRRARGKREKTHQWSLVVSEVDFVWTTKMDRVNIIRKGLPFETIEVISCRAKLPVKRILQLLNIPQTTYNKKKKDHDFLSGRNSELLLVLAEVLDFGLEVFNGESAKFHHWLKKPNFSLGGVAPESLFDTLTGIEEVRNILYKIEYGNFA